MFLFHTISSYRYILRTYFIMFDERRNISLIYRRLLFLTIIIFSIYFLWSKFNSSSTIFQTKLIKNKSSIPTLARNIYLFLCENQLEVDSYSQMFPNIASDAVFYCWRENCNSTSFRHQVILI